jgi:type I restriction enzyme S subunit
LIEDGEIKEQKSLPKISKDEVPFIIPTSWQYTRIGEVTNYGLRAQVEPTEVLESDWVLELEDIEKVTSALIQRIYARERPPKSSRNRFFTGDVLYGKLRPYLDKVIVADADGVCTTEMIPLKGYISIHSEYLRLIMKSPYFVKYASESTHGMNLPRLGTDKARLAIIPLAPENEQQRIVSKVNELFALCDGLKARLAAAQTLANQMAEGVVEHVN